MGFFDRFSRKGRQAAAAEEKQRSKQTEQSKFITLQIGEDGGLQYFSAAYDPEAEVNEARASCLQTNATYCSKAVFSSVRVGKDGEQIHDYPKLDKLLQVSPNPTMVAATFWERVAHYYFEYNNAFIYKETDAFGEIIALWSINPAGVEFARISTGELLLKFQINGKEIVVPSSEVIHIQREVIKGAVFGDQSNEAIRRVLALINLNYKGMEQAILTSKAIRFIGEYSTKVSEDRKKEAAKEFTENYLNIKNGDQVGIAYSDSGLKLTPIQQGAQRTANYAEANQWNQAVYKYYGCPEKVIAGTATEEEMVAYHERTLEPFFMRVTQEMTRKIFTDREYDTGNRIVYSSRAFAYLPMKTRLDVFRAAREIGAFTLGTLGDIIGLPVPNDKRGVVVTSQNYNDSLNEQKKPGENSDGKTGEEEGENNEGDDGVKK